LLFAHDKSGTSQGGPLFTLSIAAPADISVPTDFWSNKAQNPDLGQPSVAADPGVVYSVTNDAPSAFTIGTTSVTWTITDNAGNHASAVQKVTVSDLQKPFIYRMAEMGVPNDPGQCGARVSLITPYSYDNSGLPVTVTSNAPAVFPVGNTTVIWTATDAYGNSDTSTQLITVIDNELPTIQVTDMHWFADPGKCGSSRLLPTPVALDNCGIASLTNDAPAFFPTGTTIVHWTVKDNAGYIVKAQQNITVDDQEKPVITAPANITVANDPGQCGAADVNLGTAISSDNCGIASVINDAPAIFPSGTTLVHWTATDIHGNSQTAVQQVTVADKEAPVFINLPASITVNCDAAANPVYPAVSDNCDPKPVVSYTQTSSQGSNPARSSYFNYTITRTWQVRDAAGNASKFVQKVTVSDQSAPVLTVPAPVSVRNDANTCGAKVTYTVQAADNCSSNVSLKYSKSSGSVFPVGNTTVTVTARDVSGNTAYGSFQVQVTDVQTPTITAPANLNLSVAANPGYIMNPALGSPNTADNCGVASVSNNAPAVFYPGTTAVTWTVTDKYGNHSAATQLVTVTVSSGSTASGGGRKRSNGESANVSLSAKTQPTADLAENIQELRMIVFPNPSKTEFRVQLKSKNNGSIAFRVLDMNGKVLESKQGLAPETIVRFGGSYQSGIYLAEAIQGKTHITVKLIRLP
jgi:hypothetical protein